jgi:hypothetical protein
MSEVKKAYCPAPGAVVSAYHQCLTAMQPETPGKGCAALISEGIALIAEARQDAPRLVDMCRSKHPRFGHHISTHIPASVREQARHLKRAHGFASFQDLYLEAILRSLTKHGFLSPSLEPTAASERPRPQRKVDLDQRPIAGAGDTSDVRRWVGGHR